MSKKLIKSDYRRKLEDRDLAIYKERKKIESVDGNMMESVDKMLMAKYGLHSRTTIWRAIKRVEARLNIS